MSDVPEQAAETKPDTPNTETPKKPKMAIRSSREQLAWGLVGWMNFIAMAIVGLIIAHVSGYTLTHMVAWVVGAVVLTIIVVVGTLWLMLQLE